MAFVYTFLTEKIGRNRKTWHKMKHREEKDFYTVKELADLLSITERTVREWLEREEIKGVKLGGKGPWRIPSAELDRVLTGRKPAEELVGLATQFKPQLAVPAPETMLTDNLGGPGRHTIPLKRDLFKITWGNSAEEIGTLEVIKESWSPMEVEVNVVVLLDDTLELFCPVEEKLLFPRLLSSLSKAAQEQFSTWKRRGGDYLQRCMSIRWEITTDVRERALQLIDKEVMRDSLVCGLLTANFSNLVYRRSILYCRTRGRVDIPDRKLYRIRRWTPTLYGLYLSTKYLAKASSPDPPSPPEILDHLADLHREKIMEWSALPAIAELVALFKSLRGIEEAIKEELDDRIIQPK